MKHVIELLLPFFFTATTLVLSSCREDKQSAPGSTTTPDPITTPGLTTGTVNGHITPANAVTVVTATSSPSPATTASPTASGAYTLVNLAPGSYTLSFTPATGYAAAATAPQTVTVTARNTATATPVTASMSGPDDGSFTYTLNSTAIRANQVSANVVFGSLVLQGIANLGRRSVSISLDAVPTGPRAYSFGGAGSTSEITVIEVSGSSLAEWNTTAAGGTGTVTITSVSQNPRRV